MSDCIFCKIINGGIPSSVIYEDELFKVILDKFPSVLGHALIIPKKHSDDIFGLDEERAARLIPLAKRIASAVKSGVNADGINILQNNGAAAGQTVQHFHMHIIPRFKGDTIRMGWDSKEASAEELNKASEGIKKFI